MGIDMLPIVSLPAQDVIAAAMLYFDYNCDFHLQRDFKTNLEMIYTLEITISVIKIIKKNIFCVYEDNCHIRLLSKSHGVEKNIK